MLKKRILVIGQTPPPYGGQSINIGRMIFSFNKHNINYRLVRMNFSEEMNENGKFSLGKIWKLFILILQVVKSLVIYQPDYVYYPPSGPERIPVYRDILVLFFVRLFRYKTIFHFHAGGLSDIYPKLSSPLKALFRFAFFNPTYAICLSKVGSKDPEFLKCQNIEIIPSGVDDVKVKRSQSSNKNFTILFVGVCRETKGILDFIKVVKTCRVENPNIVGRVVGKAFSTLEEVALKEAVKAGTIVYDGVKTGSEKEIIFRGSDIFLFPTFFEHENFPTVILEAFSSGLPVVSTIWRGVTDQVVNGVNGFIHPIHDISGMSRSILSASNDSELYQTLSRSARSSYEDNYSIAQFENNIINFFINLK